MSDDTTVQNPISKTDAKELKALVRSDYRMLQDELARRREDLTDLIQEESRKRNAENQARAEKEFKALQRRVKTLNDAIVSKVQELGEEGWTDRYRGRGDNTRFPNPHDYTVTIPNLERLTPPEVNNQDLQDAEKSLRDNYYTASRSLDRQEADFVRELTLLSVTSETAREFITSLPTPESLLPAPQIIAQLTD